VGIELAAVAVELSVWVQEVHLIEQVEMVEMEQQVQLMEHLLQEEEVELALDKVEMVVVVALVVEEMQEVLIPLLDVLEV
jgi:hypothetical protein